MLLNIFGRKRRLRTADKLLDKYSKLSGKDYGLFPPPMEAQDALNELKNYFLGKDWYTINPMGTPQVNTEIVIEIILKYNGKKV